MKSYAQKRQVDFDFLVSLASAALGGKSEKDKDAVGLDDGSGLDTLPLKEFNQLKEMLGDDFSKQYGEWEELPL